jgi:hypothetical protein
VTKWKVLLIAAMVVGVVLAVVGAVAMARGARTSQETVMGPGMMRQSGAGTIGQGGRGGMMLRGSGDRQLSDQMAKLMQEHVKDMAAWQQKYGSDPASAAAQQALQQLRAEHQADMQKLWQSSGAAPSGSTGAPYGGGMMGRGTAGSGGMMGGW